MSYFSIIETETDLIVEDVLESRIIARWRKGKEYFVFDFDFDRKFEDFIFEFVDTNDYVLSKSKYECYRDAVNYFNYLKYVEVSPLLIGSTLKQVSLRLIRFEEG